MSSPNKDSDRLLQEETNYQNSDDHLNRPLKEIKIGLKYKERRIKSQLKNLEALKQIMCMYLIPVDKNALLNRPNSLRESIFGSFINLSVNYINNSGTQYVILLEHFSHALDKLGNILRIDPMIKHTLLKPIKSMQRQLINPNEVLHDTTIDPFISDISNYSMSIKTDMYKIFEHNFNEIFGYPVIQYTSTDQISSISTYYKPENKCQPTDQDLNQEDQPNFHSDDSLSNPVFELPPQEIDSLLDFELNELGDNKFLNSDSDTNVKIVSKNDQDIELQETHHITPAEVFRPLYDESILSQEEINYENNQWTPQEAIPNASSKTEEILVQSKFIDIENKLSNIIEHNKEKLICLLNQFECLKSIIIDNEEDLSGNLLNWGSYYTQLKPVHIILSEFIDLVLSNDWLDSRIHSLIEEFFIKVGSTREILLLMENRFETTLFSALTKSSSKKSRKGKNLRIAAFAVGGGVVLALTTAIAAPGVIAGLTALGLGGGLSFFTTSGGLALAASLFGASGAGLAGWKYSRRVADIKVFEFDKLSEDDSRSLRVIVCICGCLRTLNDLSDPWAQAFNAKFYDLYSLRWEPDLLLKIIEIVSLNMSKSIAIQVSQLGLKFTAAGAVAGAVALPFSLFIYASNLDNIWLTLKERAKQAGELLADAITSKKVVGKRPVNLIGYSLGARVIFYCLLELHKKKKFNNVKNVLLMGLPTSLNTNNWRNIRGVVSGRLINIYSESDWLIAFLYRYLEWGFKVAALSPVTGVEGIENYEVSGFVKSHFDYPNKLTEILDYTKLVM